MVFIDANGNEITEGGIYFYKNNNNKDLLRCELVEITTYDGDDGLIVLTEDGRLLDRLVGEGNSRTQIICYAKRLTPATEEEVARRLDYLNRKTEGVAEILSEKFSENKLEEKTNVTKDVLAALGRIYLKI